MKPPRPVLVFDGNCLFCRKWIRRWYRITGDAVEYVSSWDGTRRFPQVKRRDFDGAVYFFEADGSVFRGASAVFRTLRWTRGWEWLDELHARSPVFRGVTEGVYGFAARHRGFFSRVTWWLWGPGFNGRSNALGLSLFIRALGIVFAVHFFSLLPQVLGLFGEGGLYPAQTYLQYMGSEIGADAGLYLPSLFWWNATDSALHAACTVGGALGLVVAAGVLPGPLLLLLSILQLSFITIGGEFLQFQWDSLLVECGILGALVAPWWRLTPPRHLNLYDTRPTTLGRFLLLWLFLRLDWGAGIVKWNSGDPAWRDFTALAYHYFTQPLPNTMAWFWHQLPLWWHKISAVFMFVIEGVLPLLVFAPRRLRWIPAVGFVALQMLIIATGNFGYFNGLSLALCLPLLDDRQYRWVAARLPWVSLRRVRRFAARKLLPTGALRPMLAAAFTVLVLPVGVFILDQQAFGPPGHFLWLRRPALLAQNYSLVNPYGLFAVMTRSRREIEIEGSRDGGRTWATYALPYKPGAVERRPRQAAPYMPRLDWQLWFAALDEGLVPPGSGKPQRRRKGLAADDVEPKPPKHVPQVLRNLSTRLFEGAPEVSRLFTTDPFAGGPPPRKLRFRIYDYRFTTWGEEGWWRRKLLNRFDLVPERTD